MEETKPDKEYEESRDTTIIKNINLLRIFKDRNIKFHLIRSHKDEFKKTFDRSKF
jgi:hypothetical protein